MGARTDDVNIRLKILGARDIVRGTSMASRSITGMQKKIDRVGASSVLMAQGMESGRRGARALGTALKYTGFALAGMAAVEIPRALDAFRESQKASRNVETAIKSTGGAARVTAKDIDGLSERMMFKTGIDDEEIKNAAAMLLTFKNIRNAGGRNNKVFDRTLETTADLAARFGSDMPNAAKQLAKALNDPSQALSALRRSGVSFTDEQTEQINTWFENGNKLKAQKFILEELSTETKGAAAAQADSVDIMQAKWGELEELLGGALMPLFDDLAGVAIDATNEISAILNNDDLTGEQKFDRAMSVIDGIVKDGIEKLDDYMPLIAEAGAGLGGRLAISLGKAFLASNIWGKLFIGAWLTKILFGAQGGRVLFALGGHMGRKLGMGILKVMAPTLAADLAASGTIGQLFQTRFKEIGKWSGRMFLVGLILGIALIGVWIGKELAKRYPKVGEAMRVWGLQAGEDFVNYLGNSLESGLELIAEGLDMGNFLAFAGVDAPNAPDIPTFHAPSGKTPPPRAGKGQVPNSLIPKGAGLKPIKPQHAPGGRRSGGGGRTVVFQVPLNGRVLTELVLSEAELAAALK